MIAIATGNTVKECMKHHYYTFDGNIRMQNEGGTIGSNLTGETSRVVMADIDSRVISKLKKLGITLDTYKRYVDNIFNTCPPINPRWEFNKKANKMEF